MEEVATAFRILNEDRAPDLGQPLDRAQLFLLSALYTGNLEADAIAAHVGLSRPECRDFEANARKQGIFDGEKICASWLDDEIGEGAFFCDTLCVYGIAARS